LTIEENKILENGLDYVYPTNKFDEMAFISNVKTYFVNVLGHCTDQKDYSKKDADEQLIYNLTPIQLHYANKIRSICNNFRCNANQIIDKHKKGTNEVKLVLKDLAKDKSIQIVRPDKGRGIVIMNKTHYNNKMYQILNDTNTFKQIEHDVTIFQEDKLTRKLKQLKDERFITEKNIIIVDLPSSSISKFFPQKDQISRELQSNIVYLISCSECDSSYIGKTIRQASRRLNEHGANIKSATVAKPLHVTTNDNIDNLRRSKRNKDKIVKYVPDDETEIVDEHKLINSAIKQYEIINNHSINWNEWKVLTIETQNTTVY
ncbi:unnamed protein product, partial [Rotaria magnacalcarata]